MTNPFEQLMNAKRAEEQAEVALVPEEKKQAAVTFLRAMLSEFVQSQIREAISRDPHTWWADYHFHWGMSVRNALRDSGFGEEGLGISNLDFIYVQLIEAAVKETPA
jgi:hypothetical protein